MISRAGHATWVGRSRSMSLTRIKDFPVLQPQIARAFAISSLRSAWAKSEPSSASKPRGSHAPVATGIGSWKSTLTETLVIDEEGVYDPTQYGDRLLLGIMGTMAPQSFTGSAHACWEAGEARKGEFRMKPPIGLVYDPVGQLVLDPDEQIRRAIRLIIEVFDHSTSAMAVVKHFPDQPPTVSPTNLVRCQ